MGWAPEPLRMLWRKEKSQGSYQEWKPFGPVTLLRHLRREYKHLSLQVQFFLMHTHCTEEETLMGSEWMMHRDIKITARLSHFVSSSKRIPLLSTGFISCQLWRPCSGKSTNYTLWREILSDGGEELYVQVHASDLNVVNLLVSARCLEKSTTIVSSGEDWPQPDTSFRLRN
jgi:hypothetical protein